MRNVTTQVIPEKPTYVGIKDELDLEAICCFVACGFFLGEDTYWVSRNVLPAASVFKIDDQSIVERNRYFEWRSTPKDISLDDATVQFANILESTLEAEVADKNVILPLSGGLDSRTIAAALERIGAQTTSFSYAFDGGHDETVYAEQIAEACGFEFRRFEVESGYLWNSIDRLAEINGCYSDFTHPRQMAFIDELNELGEIFALGHWGDVLFDDMGIADDAGFEEQFELLKKKIIKPGGYELATSLWNCWGLEGSFALHFDSKLKELFETIEIRNSANARIRAFKSLYWAPRWTSINLGVFSSSRPTSIPYYSKEMCEFVCNTPESLLANRQIQIEYLKRFSPPLAKITWQSERPFNLNNYSWNKSPWNLPYRVVDKARRMASGTKLIERNWELQFLGKANSSRLREALFDSNGLIDLIPESIINRYLGEFEAGDAIKYSHPVSMMLTLSKFYQLQHARTPETNAVS